MRLILFIDKQKLRILLMPWAAGNHHICLPEQFELAPFIFLFTYGPQEKTARQVDITPMHRNLLEENTCLESKKKKRLRIYILTSKHSLAASAMMWQWTEVQNNWIPNKIPCKKRPSKASEWKGLVTICRAPCFCPLVIGHRSLRPSLAD